LGVSPAELLDGFSRRARAPQSARVRWAPPEDGPLKDAVARIAAGTVDVVILRPAFKSCTCGRSWGDAAEAQVRHGPSRAVIG
jgi:hypothetical protein